MKRFWTVKRLQWMRDHALPKSTSLGGAMALAEKKFKRKLTSRAIHEGFRKEFARTPGEFLAVETSSTPSIEATLKQENKRLTKELRAAQREATNARVVKELLYQARDHKPEIPKWITATPKRGTFHGVPTLFLSDIHHGEVVSPLQVNGANEYNMAISRQRLERVFAKATYLLDSVLTKAEYPGMVLAMGGDMLSGNIHEDARATNEVPIFQAVLDLADALTAGIRLLKKRFKKLFIPFVVGNHGRIDKKPRMKSGVYDNYEYILGHILSSRFENDECVSFAISDSFSIHYRVYGTRYLLHHGDSFRGGGGISGPLVPWALGDGRKRRQLSGVSRWTGIDCEYDMQIFGHWHQYSPGRLWIANGSLKGMDEYALKNGFSYDPPTQALWLTHPRHGTTIQTPIYGERRRERRKTNWVEVAA